ncbi:MAG: pyridoxal-phosphate dependent enzyme [Vicinamibacteria bacterium]|nr:pyridoxal-phosphate dependent enzyme [Vicinamibacteria bacterium]
MTSYAFVCSGCGGVAEAASLPFRCANAGRDDRDHVLARAERPPDATVPADGDLNPFIRYRELSASWALAKQRGLWNDDYVSLVDSLDRAVAEIDGRGLQITPWRVATKAAARLGLPHGGLWIKDETGQASGSHKARHLFGLALYLAVAERTGAVGPVDAARPFAIASCGNAALAAAVVASAARRPLQVFVPPWADAVVIDRLKSLDASIVICPRREVDPPGDPCHHRFREAVEAGALPFCCQGSDNGLTIDGGMTLGFELASQSAAAPLDRLLVQVGGGALASAVIQGLVWAQASGALARLPALHAVQTAGGFPLIRAWRRVARGLVKNLGGSAGPGDDRAVDDDAARADASAARWLFAHADTATLEHAVTSAAQDRAGFMWAWDSEPASLATGILDDETYDWLAIVRGMLLTGGWPVVASEHNVLEAWCEGRGEGIEASATGTAGLAGGMSLAQAGLLHPHERVGVLFTGVDR